MGQARIRAILAALRRLGAARLGGRWNAPARIARGLGLTVLLMALALCSAAAPATAGQGEDWTRAGTPVFSDVAHAGETLSVAPTAGGSATATVGSPLERRLRQWPAWTLPAPLTRPGRQAPRWPAWFLGDWQVENSPLAPEAGESPSPSPPWRARFRPDGHGGAVADRAFNALSVGRSVLGERLLSVQDDPAKPQRQLARLAGDQLMETTLIGQRGESPQPEAFLNDELSLQVLHGPGAPRVSRIETLGHWRLLGDGTIAGEQWQARYDSPAGGLLAAPAQSTAHWHLRLVPVPPGSDPATRTAAQGEGCR